MKISSHSTFGLALIVIGLFLLAILQDAFPLDFVNLLCCFPVLIIIIGLLIMTSKNCLSGSFVALVGVFFFLPRLSVYMGWERFPYHFTYTYWPLLIVLLGIYVIAGGGADRINKKIAKKRSADDEDEGTPAAAKHTAEDTPSQQDSSPQQENTSQPETDAQQETPPQQDTTFGDAAANDTESDSSIHLKRKVYLSTWRYQAPQAIFEGGQVESTMSQVELDLRNAQLQHDATLTIANLMSEVKIYVPANWNILIRNTPMAGEVKDQRHYPINAQGPQLLIDGNCTFASIFIFN